MDAVAHGLAIGFGMGVLLLLIAHLLTKAVLARRANARDRIARRLLQG